jgi:hypothetical protein
LKWKSPQAPRAKKVRQVQNSTTSVLIVFSTWRGLFTVNLFLLILWSTLTFTVTFWNTWEKMCDENNRNFGTTTTGSFITTMHLPTSTWKPQSLWLITTWLSFPTIPTHWTYAPVISLCFLNWKWDWRDDILKLSDIQRELQAVPDCIKENDFHSSFEAWKK